MSGIDVATLLDGRDLSSQPGVGFRYANVTEALAEVPRSRMTPAGAAARIKGEIGARTLTGREASCGAVLCDAAAVIAEARSAGVGTIEGEHGTALFLSDAVVVAYPSRHCVTPLGPPQGMGPEGDLATLYASSGDPLTSPPLQPDGATGSEWVWRGTAAFEAAIEDAMRLEAMTDGTIHVTLHTGYDERGHREEAMIEAEVWEAGGRRPIELPLASDMIWRQDPRGCVWMAMGPCIDRASTWKPRPLRRRWTLAPLPSASLRLWDRIRAGRSLAAARTPEKGLDLAPSAA